MFVGDYAGIGKVYTTHTSRNEWTYEKLAAEQLSSSASFETTASSWLKNNETEAYAVYASDITRAVSRETVESLERCGICCVRYSKDMPLGGYALDAFSYTSSLLSGREANVAEDDLFVFCQPFYGRFSLASAPALSLTKDEIEKASFTDVSTTAQVIALCRPTGDHRWQWGQSRAYPDGCHVQPALTAVEQYAQSAFEGMIATVGDRGEILLFRPEKNAKRFAVSCAALAIPPLSEKQFVESVKLAVLANKKYLPRPGSKAKMYIRPYVKGLDGGYGVGPAQTYLFAVEVFPFGAYLGSREDLAHLIGMKGKRRSHEGGFGAIKASGNYGQTILDKVLAKQGGLSSKGTVYQDIFYFGERRQKLKVGKKTYTVVDDVVDEDSSGNILFLKTEKGKTTLYTAPLKRRAVLPGVTRESLLALAPWAGLRVQEKELTFDDIQKMDVGIISGTALGMVRLGSLTYGNKIVRFASAHEADPKAPECVRAFTRLYDLLFDARRGALKEKGMEARSWAQKIGKV